MQVYLVSLVQLVVTLITVLLILHALISFAPIDPWHPVRRFLDRMAEPIVRPFRNILPPMGMFDLSPMFALIVVQILGQILIVIIRSAFRS